MNDDKLLLYYYADELSRDERRQIEAELAANPGLRARYDALQHELDGMRDMEAVKAPEHMVARWHDSIDRAATLERQQSAPAGRSFHFASFAWGSALAATLVLGIGIGFYFSGTEVPHAPVEPGPATANVVDVTPSGDASSPFTRGLQLHFQQASQGIGGMSADSSAEREMLIMHIIQQNRLFVREAKENNSPELARVLRAFEPILARLAADSTTPEEAAKLQAKLAFELNAMLTKMNQPPSNSSESI